MRRNGHLRQRAIAAGPVQGVEIQLAEGDLGHGGALGRCEAEALATPAKGVDPYETWLALRQHELERERPAIRWVYRPSTTPAGNGRPDSDAGLVTA